MSEPLSRCTDSASDPLFEEKVEFHQLIGAGVVDHLGAGIIRAARYINAHLRPKIAEDKSYLCWEDHIREKHDGRLQDTNRLHRLTPVLTVSLLGTLYKMPDPLYRPPCGIGCRRVSRMMV
jgi:hypothetical protein